MRGDFLDSWRTPETYLLCHVNTLEHNCRGRHIVALLSSLSYGHGQLLLVCPAVPPLSTAYDKLGIALIEK